jgi:hypothetical protein
MPPRSRPLVLALAGCALALAPRAASAQAGLSLELRVQRAIERGVGWLVREQRPDGFWPGEDETHPGGPTSLVALTLVKSGLPRDDPHLRDALAALRKVVFKSTYSASVFLMLQAALIDKSRTNVAGEGRDCFEFLIDHQQEGLWAYPHGGIDMSNTQFALLGLRAGAELGFEVPDKTLESCIPALFRWQRPDGGFAYEPGRDSTGGMTAATLGGLAVLAELGRKNERVAGLLARQKPNLQRAESWMEQHLLCDNNPYGERFFTTSWHYAHLWAIERWCGLTGRQKVGTQDWYRTIAAWLVDEQRAHGAWGHAGSEELRDTCFALLFLRRSTISAHFELGEMWKQLDREKAAQAAKPKLAPLAEVPYATEWLACGPLRDKPGLPQFLDPSGLHLEQLHARERGKLDGQEFVRVSLRKEGWTNLDQALAREHDSGECLLAAALAWEPGKGQPAAPLEALLWLTFEDGVKVWLDGKPVGASLRMQAAIEECLHVRLSLAPGVHELLVLLGDERGDAAFAARFTDAEGRVPPAGFVVTPEPPRTAKKH